MQQKQREQWEQSRKRLEEQTETWYQPSWARAELKAALAAADCYIAQLERECWRYRLRHQGNRNQSRHANRAESEGNVKLKISQGKSSGKCPAIQVPSDLWFRLCDALNYPPDAPVADVVSRIERRSHSQLVRQRDELLAACKAADKELEKVFHLTAQRILRAAIATVEAEKGKVRE